MPTEFIAVPDWGSWENRGAGLAVADPDGDGALELVVFQVDSPVGANRASTGSGVASTRRGT